MTPKEKLIAGFLNHLLIVIVVAVLLAAWTALALSGRPEVQPIIEVLKGLLTIVIGGKLLLTDTKNSDLTLLGTTDLIRMPSSNAVPPAESAAPPDSTPPAQGGFIRSGLLGILLSLGFILVLSMAGCGKSMANPSSTYTPPTVCTGTFDNATGAYLGTDSEILKVLPNPVPTGVVLQLADYAAIKSGVYKATDALKVIADIEAALDAATDYGSLAVYVSGKLADANTAAGAQIFVSTGLLSQFTSRSVISECDKAIIKKHLAAQRSIITALAGK